METIAKVRFAKGSPRKFVRVVNSIRKKHVSEALVILRFAQTGASKIVEKLLHSAVANAKRTNANPVNLFVKEVSVQQGPMTKRFKPASRYHVRGIRRKTTHLTIKLDEKAAKTKSISA